MIRFANFLAFNINPAYEAIAVEIGNLLDMPVSFSEGQSFSQFQNNEIDVGFICGLPYSQLSREDDSLFELLVAPILVGERYQHQPIYFSDIIVHRDSDIHTFADLKDRHFAYNEAVSYSGYFAVEHYLGTKGLGWDYFGTVTRSGAHVNSMAGVASGDYDAAAIDSHAIDVELNLKPEFANQIRIIDMIGPSPIPPIVVTKSTPPDLKAKLRAAFLALNNDKALLALINKYDFAGFCEIEDGAYDLLRSRVPTKLDFLGEHSSC